MPPVAPLVTSESALRQADAAGNLPGTGTAIWPLSFAIHPERVVRTLSVIIALLLLGHVLVGFARHKLGLTHLYGLIQMFNLVQENNAPTFYSSFTLLACSALLAFVALAARTSDRKFLLHWIVLAVGFAYLSYDEFAQLHEKVAVYFEDLKLVAAEGFLKYLWVIPYGIAATFVGLAFIPFLLHLPRPIARLFVASGAVYLVGAIGFEMITGKLGGMQLGGFAVGVIMPCLEEGFEMGGVALFIYSILRYIRDYVGPLQLTVPAERG
jgi:hypothetical protein